MKRAWFVSLSAVAIVALGSLLGGANTVRHSRHQGYFADANFHSETGGVVTDVNMQIPAGHLKGPIPGDEWNFTELEEKAPAVLLVITHTVHDIIHETGRQRETFQAAWGIVMMGSTNLTPTPTDAGWIMREEFCLTRITR